MPDVEMFRDVYQDTNPFLKTMNEEELQNVWTKVKNGNIRLNEPPLPRWMLKELRKLTSK